MTLKLHDLKKILGFVRFTRLELKRKDYYNSLFIKKSVCTSLPNKKG